MTNLHLSDYTGITSRLYIKYHLITRKPLKTSIPYAETRALTFQARAYADIRCSAARVEYKSEEMTGFKSTICVETHQPRRFGNNNAKANAVQVNASAGICSHVCVSLTGDPSVSH